MVYALEDVRIGTRRDIHIRILEAKYTTYSVCALNGGFRNETKLTVIVCGYWSCRLILGKYTTTQVSRELQIIFELPLGNGSCR